MGAKVFKMKSVQFNSEICLKKLAGIRITPMPKSRKKRLKIHRRRVFEFFNKKINFMPVKNVKCPDTGIYFIMTTFDDGSKMSEFCMFIGRGVDVKPLIETNGQ